MTTSQRLVSLAARLSPAVRARVAQAHPTRVLAVATDGSSALKDGPATDAGHTSWADLFPEAATSTDRSRAPYDLTELGSGRTRARVYVPETGAVFAAVGRTAAEAAEKLEAQIRALPEVSA